MLGLRPLPRTLDACLRDITSAKWESRAGATEELGRHVEGSDLVPDDVRARAIAALEKALSDEHPAVRSRAATALADAKATSALPKLLVAVEDDDAFVRQMALSALGELGDSRATVKLERALADARPEVRYQALIAYTRVHEEGAPTAITAALGDDDCAVRHIALRLAEDRLEAAAALPAHSRAAEGLLDDEHGDVCVAAATYLARALHEDAPAKAKAILLAVARGEPASEVGSEEEQGALEACAEAKLVEAIPALERRAYGLARFVRDTSATSAKSALAGLGHARAIADLLDDLGSRGPEKRGKAIVAVGRARLQAAREKLTALAKDPATRELAEEALSRLGAAP